MSITTAALARIEAAWEARLLDNYLSGEDDVEQDDEMDTYWAWAFEQADAKVMQDWLDREPKNGVGWVEWLING